MNEFGVRDEMVPSSRWGGRLSLVALALAAAGYGCSAQQGVQRLADGSYRVECEAALLPCLEPVAKICELHGYDVVKATEDRKRYGPSPWQADVVKSSAVVRCREAKPFFLFGGGESQPAPVPSGSARPVRSATPPPPPPPPPVAPGCVPGTSLACAAPSGCTGAQICAPDGRRFGPCECAAPAPAATPVAPPADAGAP
ncbi:MAG TPA: hypothetical protein VGK73_06885 [Polyangiaceae bacterium]